MIIALIVKVGQDPEAHAIVETLPCFQAIVGGHIEAIRLDEHTILYCNEDGHALGLPFNCFVGKREAGALAIHGDFFLVGEDGMGEVCSLKPEQVKTWGERIREAKAAHAERLGRLT